MTARASPDAGLIADDGSMNSTPPGTGPSGQTIPLAETAYKPALLAALTEVLKVLPVRMQIAPFTRSRALGTLFWAGSSPVVSE
jgi:hypothetical protein